MMPRKRVLRALIILRLLIATVKIASAGEECSTLTAADVQKITGAQVHNVLRESKPGGGGRCANNPSTFFFCAYHGSVDFSDIGHVLFTVEPFQAVAGCEVAPPNPNSELADSTNSVLSHELFETITDPDPPTGWVANSSLDEQGFEIGDECQPIGNQNFQFLTPTFLVNGKHYELDFDYSM